MKLQPKHKILPNKPSALIRLALKDLALAEKAKNIVIDMSNWHVNTGTGDKYCSVCFAGCVMRGLVDDNKTIYAFHFPTATRNKFYALDSFRLGRVRQGLSELDIIDYNRSYIRNRAVVSYHQDPQKFKKQMANLSDTLERHGL